MTLSQLPTFAKVFSFLPVTATGVKVFALQDPEGKMAYTSCQKVTRFSKREDWSPESA